MSANERHSPPVNAYAVSQYWQRSGQPVSRTNTVGQPLKQASPWIEKKISVILSRSAAVSGAADAVMTRALLVQTVEALRGEPCRRRARELARDFLQRRARLAALAELGLTEAD